MLLRIGWLCALAALACGNGRADGGEVVRAQSKSAHARAPKPGADALPEPPEFEAPDASGWGRAAGLRYLERCLGGAKQDDRVPLVVMIHGLGDRPRFDWFDGADAITTPLRLVMPQAPTPHHDGFAWFPYRARDNDAERLARAMAGAADGLAQAIRVLRAQRPTRGRAIVTGFSQGGMLSYALALRHPELVEISLPVSGLLPEPLWPARKPAGVRSPRIAALHGNADEIVPIGPARSLITHLKQHGYDAELREYEGVPHTITDAMVAAQVELLNAAARDRAGAQ